VRRRAFPFQPGGACGKGPKSGQISLDTPASFDDSLVGHMLEKAQTCKITAVTWLRYVCACCRPAPRPSWPTRLDKFPGRLLMALSASCTATCRKSGRQSHIISHDLVMCIIGGPPGLKSCTLPFQAAWVSARAVETPAIPLPAWRRPCTVGGGREVVQPKQCSKGPESV